MRQLILDTETTGLDPNQGHRIIELAGLEVVNRRATGRTVHYHLDPEREISTWLTSTPILTTAPQMMREGEKRGGPDGDNLSAIVVRWGPETLTDEPSTTITETLGLGEFQTQIDRTLTLTDRKGVQRDLSDDEIERAIAEIQATIKRYKT